VVEAASSPASTALRRVLRSGPRLPMYTRAYCRSRSAWPTSMTPVASDQFSRRCLLDQPRRLRCHREWLWTESPLNLQTMQPSDTRSRYMARHPLLGVRDWRLAWTELGRSRVPLSVRISPASGLDAPEVVWSSLAGGASLTA
jgi:hypothetical protein